MKSSTHRSPLALALGAALVFLGSEASAQRCDGGVDGGVDPSLAGVLRDTFPADQGTAVPINTPVRVRYFVRAPTPPTLCVRVRGESECVEGDTAAVADEVIFTPRSAFRPLTDYTVSFADAAGGTNRINFRTGRGEAPTGLTFAGISNLNVDRNVRDECDPEAADIRVQFNLASPQGDGFSTTAWPDVDIEYVVYETRGPNVSGPRERERFRAQLTGAANDRSQQRTFRLSGADAAGPVCFLVRAVDPLGRADTNGEEKCVNPAEGNYFDGCSTRTKPGRFALPLAALAIVAGIAARRRR